MRSRARSVTSSSSRTSGRPRTRPRLPWWTRCTGTRSPQPGLLLPSLQARCRWLRQICMAATAAASNIPLLCCAMTFTWRAWCRSMQPSFAEVVSAHIYLPQWPQQVFSNQRTHHHTTVVARAQVITWVSTISRYSTHDVQQQQPTSATYR